MNERHHGSIHDIRPATRAGSADSFEFVRRQIKLQRRNSPIYQAILRTITFSLLYSLIAMPTHLLWLPTIDPAFAEQLIQLGQEKARSLSPDVQSNGKWSTASKDAKTLTGKSHKLIKKAQQPTATLSEVSTVPPGKQPNTTSSTSLSTTTSSTSTQTTNLSNPTNSVAPLAVGPMTATSTTTTSASFAGAISGSTGQTSSVSSPSTSFAAAGSSSGGSTGGGRSTQKLISTMPGLAQLITPTTNVTSPSPSAPTIGRNPASLSFSAVQNGVNPASQSVTISNSGTGTLSWTATSMASWLTLNGASSVSGTDSGSFAAGVNVSGLSVGTYNGTIAIAAIGATNSPQSIAVTLTITTAPTPTIGLSASSFAFSAVQGGNNPATQSLTITNTGSGTLTWTVAESANWLTPSVLSGTGTGTVVLSVNTAGMAAGTYSVPMTVAASGATNTPQTVTVTLTLTAPQIPTISLNPTSLAFSANQGGSNPAAQTVSITNSGTGTLSWSVGTAAPWLSLSPVSGTAPMSFTATANISGFAAGTYSTTITVTGTGATNTPQSIPVTLTIAAGSTLTLNVSPTSLSFTATQGAANPANQTLTVTSNTSWTVSENASWLTVNPTSASNNGTLTVSVNTATATVGTNTATITVTGGGITRTVTVTLTLSTSGSSSAILTWNASTGSNITSYRVYQSTTSGVYGAAIATVPASTLSYTGTGLQVGTTYFFTVTAVDSSNNESPHSNEVSKSIF